MATAPTFSLDGRYVYSIVHPRGSEPHAVRFSIVEPLAALQAQRLARSQRPGAAARRTAASIGPLNGPKIVVQLSGHIAPFRTRP